ncbi:DUF2798 domain-containing protein [Undibacterium rugosum]|nr:DUF2798 domain-containing protein [Undibacterium rugosum]
MQLHTSNTIFGLPKLPARYASLVMPFLLSILMTCVVSGVSTLRSLGWSSSFLHVWLSAWAISWMFAFPTLLIALPVVRKLTACLVRSA